MKAKGILVAAFVALALAACTDDTGLGPGRQEGYLYFNVGEGTGWADGNRVSRAAVEAPMKMECSLDGQPIYLHTEVTPTMSPQLEQALDNAEGADSLETRGIRYTNDVFSISSGGTPKISNIGVYASRSSDHGVILNYKDITPVTPPESYSGSNWNYDWNVKEEEIEGVWDSGTADFYGYAPYFSNPSTDNGLSMAVNGSGVPVLTYTVPADVTKQLDILTAKQTSVPKNTEVELEFDHVMSAIKFNFKYGSTPDGTPADGGTPKDNFRWSDGVTTYDVKVTNIQITGVYKEGTWLVGDDPYDGARWTVNTSAGTGNFSYAPAKTLTGSSSPVDLNPDASGNVFMMLPQQVPAGAKVLLTCELTPDGESTATKNMSLAVNLLETDGTTPKTWLPGYTYTYTMSLSDFVYVFDFDVSQDYDRETPSANANVKHPLEYTNVSYDGYDSYPLMIRSYKMDSRGNKEEIDWTIKHEILEVQGDPESGTATTVTTVSENGFPEWIKLFEAPGDVKGTEVTTASHAGAVDGSTDRQFRLEVSSIEVPVIDLSLYNYDQTALWTARNTANCYIVANPGTYRIPLVYGNAIHNGTDNKKAYQSREAIADPSASQPDGNYLYRMLNHAGAPIFNPYINDMGNTVKNGGEAALVWEEVDGLFDDVRLNFDHDTDEDGYNSGKNQGYLEFTIKPNKFNYGNAVVGVRQKNTTNYYWSWHIWITNPTDFLNTVEVDIKDTHTVKFAGQNVGWVSAQSEQAAKRRNGRILLTQNDSHNELELDIDQLRSSNFTPYLTNTLYQWGRKDPMRGINSASNHGTDNGTPRYNEDPVYTNAAGTHPTLQTMIQNPNTIYGLSRGDLYEKSYTNLWGSNCNKKKLTYTYYGKTIYDPCPVGFCVPPSKSFSKLNKSYRSARTGLFARAEQSGFVELDGTQPSPVMCEYRQANGGPSVYFPIAGIRSYDGTYSLTASGYYTASHATAYYQTASPYSEDENWGMRIDVYDNRILGIPVQDTHVGNFKPDHNSAGAVRPVVYFGETAEEADLDPDLAEPLTFKIQSDGKIGWRTTDALVRNRSLYYSKNNSELLRLETGSGNDITVATGDIIQFYVYAASEDEDDVDVIYASTDGLGVTRYQSFYATADFVAYGNIMSLITDDYETANAIYNADTFRRLFGDGCGSHLKGFSTTDPNTGDVLRLRLPATTLQPDCYRRMFYQCTAITDGPVLPATEMATRCYMGMFEGCTALTTAPTLPATTLVDDCYRDMFNGCTALNYINAQFTTNPDNHSYDAGLARQKYKYTDRWVRGVTGSGRFVKNPSAAWTLTGENGIPTNFTPE